MVALAAAGAAAATAALGLGPDAAPPGTRPDQRAVDTIVLDARHSRFTPAVVQARPGTTLRFVVRNHDPIDHELIVGPPAVHEAHERGTHARHGDVPGEISVPAGATAETTYTFAQPGTVVFTCHLPGHAAYGMTGVVEVR